MRKIKTKILTTSLLLLTLTAIISGCKKTEITTEDLKVNTTANAPAVDDPQLNNGLLPLGPSIDELKTYMSSLIDISTSEITYDENSQQFFVAGLPQISLNDLSKSYEQNNGNGI